MMNGFRHMKPSSPTMRDNDKRSPLKVAEIRNVHAGRQFERAMPLFETADVHLADEQLCRSIKRHCGHASQVPGCVLPFQERLPAYARKRAFDQERGLATRDGG